MIGRMLRGLKKQHGLGGMTENGESLADFCIRNGTVRQGQNTACETKYHVRKLFAEARVPGSGINQMATEAAIMGHLLKTICIRQQEFFAEEDVIKVNRSAIRKETSLAKQLQMIKQMLANR